MDKEPISIFWFRRDLRLHDNKGLHAALNSQFPVLPIFIFDESITNELEETDSRITFIHDQLNNLATKLKNNSSSLLCKKGSTEDVWRSILNRFNIQEVYTNEDYEPYAIRRDEFVEELLTSKEIDFKIFKDQVIFAKDEILKTDHSPYTVFTPYKNKWLRKFESNKEVLNTSSSNDSNFLKVDFRLPSLNELGFKRSSLKVHDFNIDQLNNYGEARNFPALNQTSHLSPHLRFGTVSIRYIVKHTASNEVFLSELIWREFFMHILYHFKDVVHSNFKKKYDHIEWRNNLDEFEKWKNGKTGYPMVDAGMRELNSTGYMHNRVRMVAAGFLCKHLLIDWKWGEAYFAEKLLDYELSSNNGNWQWAAGTGCDAAPYFRIFNPSEQVKKFDPEMTYINKWVPELSSLNYPSPIVDHKMARTRALEVYKRGILLHPAKPTLR